MCFAAVCAVAESAVVPIYSFRMCPIVIQSWHVGSGMQYLVKWKGLGYDECTWESLHDLMPKFKPEVARFESQQPIANELIERQKSHYQVYKVAAGAATMPRCQCSVVVALCIPGRKTIRNTYNCIHNIVGTSVC